MPPWEALKLIWRTSVQAVRIYYNIQQFPVFKATFILADSAKGQNPPALVWTTRNGANSRAPVPKEYPYIPEKSKILIEAKLFAQKDSKGIGI